MAGTPQRYRRRSTLRVWIPVIVSAIVQLGTTFGALATRGMRPWLREAPSIDQPVLVVVAALALALAGPALLIWIRRRPGPLLTAIAAAAVVGGVLLAAAAGAVAFYLSVLFAIAIAVRHGARVWAWVVTGVLWLTPIAIYVLTAQVGALFLLVPWTIVSILLLVLPERARVRQEWLEQRRLEEAQAERVRIARELHDVLAHSLSQINVQASVGLHLFDSQPDKAAEALASIKESSKQALGEVRQVLGMLRGDAPLAPEPGLEDLDRLVAERHGVATTLSTLSMADEERIPAAVQQAVYRIVQEALTNVTKHAAARHVAVDVAADDGWLTVSVTDDGVGAAASASPDGRGLLGMRERAELLGGTFSAGPASGRGFRVEARFPLGSAR